MARSCERSEKAMATNWESQKMAHKYQANNKRCEIDCDGQRAKTQYQTRNRQGDCRISRAVLLQSKNCNKTEKNMEYKKMTAKYNKIRKRDCQVQGNRKYLELEPIIVAAKLCWHRLTCRQRLSVSGLVHFIWNSCGLKKVQGLGNTTYNQSGYHMNWSIMICHL